MNSPGKIDVHHHVYPLLYTEALHRNGDDPSGWYIPPWTTALDDEMCTAARISTAILSCTAPGPSIEPDPEASAALARSCNEFCAALRDAQPTRYGFFASVPDLALCPSLALTEIEFALITLRADGIILFTSYGSPVPKYLGNPAFAPIWKALSAHKAVVFIHPTHAAGSTQVSPLLPQPAFDYPHETGRAAIDLITSGRLRDEASGCKIILSHGGGTLPVLIDRVAGLMPFAPAGMKSGMSRDEMLGFARGFYYDTALSSSPMALKGLFALLGARGRGRVLFGSDFPNAPDGSIEYFTRQLEESGEVDVRELRANALELFPRLRGEVEG
jgi:predicted TIM-barrel fold metal-dependent hydrolase